MFVGRLSLSQSPAAREEDSMSTEVLERRFASIGARVKVNHGARGDAVRIDVGTDRRGEFFELQLARRDELSLVVVDADRDDRSLLLLVRDGDEKSRFLCGFDERHWFVAAIPESARGVSGVDAAKDALQPDAVREAVAKVRPRDRFRRRNAAYVRQGEWFFLPQWHLVVDESAVLHNEPLSRGAGSITFSSGRSAVAARQCSSTVTIRPVSAASSSRRYRSSDSVAAPGVRWCATRTCSPWEQFAIPITTRSSCTAGIGC